MTDTLSRDELDQRIAFLRRFKDALVRQRQRFQHFLDLLERGAEVDASPEDALEFHVAVEEAVARDIALFERTIMPLEALYEAHSKDDDTDIPQIRLALRKTRDEVIRRAHANKAHLKHQIEEISSVVSTTSQTDLRKSSQASRTPGFRISAFRHDPVDTPVLVDLKA